MKRIFETSRLAEASVLVVGDVMLDRYLWGSAQRISPEAPVPVVRVADRSEVLGGAANVAANLSGLGCRVGIVGVRGSDPAGGSVIRLMGERGIHDLGFEEDRLPTTTKTRIVAHGQQLMRFDEETTHRLGRDLRDRLAARVEEMLPGFQAVILSDYGKGLFQTPRLTERIISLCRRAGVPILVDPKGGDWGRYEGATCVTPNTGELETVIGHPLGVGEADLVPSLRTIRGRYRFGSLLLTRGEKGILLVDSCDESHTITGKTCEVYDVSGAGDTVIATLGAAVACGIAVPQAAVLANEAAGLVVTKLGTQPIRREELDAAIRMNGMDSKNGRSRKVGGLGAARLQIQAWRAAGETIVFTNGCFDLLHHGHIHLLHQARDLGDRLVVGLNSDASVTRLKGPGRPILSECDRSELLAALSSVDMVVTFTEDTPLTAIGVLKPDILIKGSDYRPETVVGRDLVESYGGKVAIVDLLEGVSTTGIVDRISRSPSAVTSSPP